MDGNSVWVRRALSDFETRYRVRPPSVTMATSISPYTIELTYLNRLSVLGASIARKISDESKVHDISKFGPHLPER